MNEYGDVLAMLVEECRTLRVSLGDIVEAVKVDLRQTDSLDVRATTLALVRDLIAIHGMVAGDFDSAHLGRYVAWRVPLKCVLDVIDHEWAVLKRDPDLGEIAWLTDPEPLT